MLIRTFVLMVINNDRKSLTDHEIIDRIAEQIESAITQVLQRIEILDSSDPKLTAGKILIY